MQYKVTPLLYSAAILQVMDKVASDTTGVEKVTNTLANQKVLGTAYFAPSTKKETKPGNSYCTRSAKCLRPFDIFLFVVSTTVHSPRDMSLTGGPKSVVYCNHLALTPSGQHSSLRDWTRAITSYHRKASVISGDDKRLIARLDRAVSAPRSSRRRPRIPPSTMRQNLPPCSTHPGTGCTTLHRLPQSVQKTRGHVKRMSMFQLDLAVRTIEEGDISKIAPRPLDYTFAMGSNLAIVQA